MSERSWGTSKLLEINHLYKKLPKLPYSLYKENELFKNVLPEIYNMDFKKLG
uniref:Uncharacterized protein n=1 Tax=Myoviridae sp. cts9u10 TaxID=2825187 RepID=A0A8S5NXM9_9CAUD|nr:MAG TPA: hypothetical protein [Myoviridae sp. cts9u10]